MPVDEYIELLRHGADVEPGLKVAADFQMTYYTAFSILLNRLREDKPEAVDLLRLCVFFAPGPIPVRLLRDLPIRDLPEQLTGLMDDPLLWNAAISKLTQWSVIQSDPQETGSEESAGSTDVVQMHRLVYQAVRADMPDEEQSTYSRVVRKILAAADPARPTDTRLWPRYAEIVPHLAASGALESTNPEIQLMVLNCLRYLYLSGEYRAGLRVAQLAAEKWPAVAGARPPPAVGPRPPPGQPDARHRRLHRHRADRPRTPTSSCAPTAATTTCSSCARPATSPPTCAASAAYQEALELAQSVRDGYRELVGEQDSRTLSAQNNIAVTLPAAGPLRGRPASSTGTPWRPAGNCCATATTGRSPRRTPTPTTCGCSAATTRPPPYRSATARCTGWCWVPTTRRRCAPSTTWRMCYYRGGDRPRAANLLARLLERCERVLGDTDPLDASGSAVALSSLRTRARRPRPGPRARRVRAAPLPGAVRRAAPVHRGRARQPRAGAAGRRRAPAVPARDRGRR